MIQIGGVYTTFCQEEVFWGGGKNVAIEMGGVSLYFSNVSGSGVNVTLLMEGPTRKPRQDRYVARTPTRIFDTRVLKTHQVELGERQSIAQKGVRVVGPRKTAARNS